MSPTFKIRCKSRDAVALSSLLGWLTQSLHDQRQKRTSKQHLQACIHQHVRFWAFLYSMRQRSSIILIVVESNQDWFRYRKIPNRSNPIFEEENFSFFEDSKNGPTTITLLSLNHCIDFRGDSEYKLQVAGSLVKSLQPYCVIISKITLKQVFLAFGKALPNRCFVGKKHVSPLSRV